MRVTMEDIEEYLSEVKKAVVNNRYRIDRNTKRMDNIGLFLDYIIDEAGAQRIILDLTSLDFSEIVQNEHEGYEQELLYVFGKNVVLRERHGGEKREIPLYIKLNRLKSRFVVVISFHEQKRPLTYYFR